MKLYITAIIKVKPAYQEEVKVLLLLMVEASRKEEACLRYDLHVDQSDANTFVFYEIWKDQQGLTHHNQQPYIQEFTKLIDTKLHEKPSIYLTHKI